MNLTPIEHKILKVLVESYSYMSTREIALKASISWNTAIRYLEKFYRRRWLSRKSVGNRTYWKAII